MKMNERKDKKLYRFNFFSIICIIVSTISCNSDFSKKYNGIGYSFGKKKYEYKLKIARVWQIANNISDSAGLLLEIP